MEKDLRDAYAALKLLRADLVKTRRDKRALEASLTYQQTHGPPPSAAQTRESRETQRMQQEDANCQLWRMAAKYEARLAEMESQFNCNNCQKKDTSPEIEDNQQEENAELEKLALLNKLHSLTATVKQQTETMVTQQAAFALQRGELETRLEDTEHQLQEQKTQLTDAVLEQQAVNEKYEFLETQVEILKEEKQKLETKLAAHAQTSSILKQQLEEKEEERLSWENEQQERELELQLEFKQKTDELVEERTLKIRRESEVEVEEVREEYERKMKELQQRNELLEAELASERENVAHDHEEVQERNAVALCDLEIKCEKLQAQLDFSEAERGAEATKCEEKVAMVRNLETELEDLKHQLAASETTRAAETTDYERKLSEALKELQVQQKNRQHDVVTLRGLEDKLVAVQSQLEASEVKLEEETEQYEKKLASTLKKLHDMEDEHEQQVVEFRDLGSNYDKLQEKFADAESQAKENEAKFLEASERASQHEKSAHTLAIEKRALQQEVREARQTSKLTAEEFLKCQSVMEQKTQEHLKYLAEIQEQCESLESQLLAAEDHKELVCETNSFGDLFVLKAFHGLSESKIAALPPAKSWSLLRSGIAEMDGFLPQLQTLLSIIHESLQLCGSHANMLSSLCERLEAKCANEKEQPPVRVIALKMLRFALALKARIAQEDISVTQKNALDFRSRVVDALAQWYECEAGDEHGGKEEIPTPTFTITSRETALILQNWTRDRTKQVGVRRWLARMEAYPGVPPLRGASSNRVLELPPEGCTLELEDMTLEVKDAFRLLLIPILKQNRALHVRVFTRYTGGRAAQKKQQHELNDVDDEVDEEKVWAMRIHVQSAITVRARPNGSIRPPPLNLTPSPRGFLSSLAPTSPASSVSSSSSSSASSRLQIIQERLQYLHNNA